MAFDLYDRIRATTGWLGSGDIDDLAAVNGYDAPGDKFAAGDWSFFMVTHELEGFDDWVVFEGTVGGDGSITVGTILGSSNGGAAVTFSAGTKLLLNDFPASRAKALYNLSFVTLGTDANLPNERVLTAGSNITLTDNGAGSTLVIAGSASYTDEQAQDAVGGILTDSSTIDFTYDGGTSSITASVIVAGLSGIDHGSQITGLSDDDHTQYALLAPTTDARNVIQPTAADVNALVLKGAASQSDNLLEVQNSSGTELAAITQVGAIGAGAVPASNVMFTIKVDGGGSYQAFTVQNVDSGGYATHFGVTTGTGSLGSGNSEYWQGFKDSNGWWFRSRASGTGTARRMIWTVTGTTPFWVVNTDGRVGNVLSPATLLEMTESDAVTNAVTNVVTIGHNTSGTAAAGFGAGLTFRLESSTTADQDSGVISCAWTNATHATRTSKLSFSTYYTSTAQANLTMTAHASGVRFSITSVGGYLTCPGGLTAGASNEVFGQGAGAALASGATNNTLTGYGAGAAITTSDNHTIAGYLSAPTLTTGDGCTIYGTGADVYNATDNGAAVFGHEARAGDGCSAFGRSTTAQGTNAASFGKACTAGGAYGLSLGFTCLAANTDAIVIGDTQQSNASYQTLIGRRLSGDGAGSFCFGHKEQDTYLSWLRDTSGVGSGSAKAQMRIVPGWDVSTEGSQMGKVSVQVMDVTTARKAVEAIAVSGAVKLGLYATTPTIQYATTGTTTGFTAGGGTAVNDDSTFTGNTGSTAYTIGDVVRALKLLGAMAP